MSRPIIEVQHLSKRYQLGAIGATSLREEARRLWDRARGVPHPDSKEFWALRDVSFDVHPGEVVGVIGRNGAGKSTLLKILSRITEPTGGTAKLRGRVASLLEVGTGFHPELSGRENVFLNGAILGMTRAEVRGKFDEIVAFAEVDQFIDTPVKRYSSGMYVRLAFAVAAHLEPEILIVDEVLAVGDQTFQDKCLGKLRAVAGGGRTVLFVSHNMAATRALCSRLLLMGAGHIEFNGLPAEAVTRYLSQGAARSPDAHSFHGHDPALRVSRAAFTPTGNSPDGIEIEVVVRTSVRRRLAVEFLLRTTSGVPAAFADCGTLDFSRRPEFPAGETRLAWRVDVSALANGPYLLCTHLVDPFAHILLRHEYSELIEVSRSPATPTRRVLELSWQAGVVELPLRRMPDRDPPSPPEPDRKAFGPNPSP